jgi:hypothetical protein
MILPGSSFLGGHSINADGAPDNAPYRAAAINSFLGGLNMLLGEIIMVCLLAIGTFILFLAPQTKGGTKKACG